MGIKVLMDRGRRLTTAASGVLPQGNGFVLQPVAAGIGSPHAAVEKHRCQASELLAQDDVAGAIAELEATKQIDPSYSQDASVEILDEGRIRMSVDIDGRKGLISVRYWPEEGEGSPTAAFLVPRESPSRARETDFQKQEGYYWAEFDDIPSGEFEILV